MNIFRFFQKNNLFSGDIVGGRNIVIRGRTVEVDGKVIGDIEDTILTIRVEGVIENLTTDRSVECREVRGDIESGMGVNCGNVQGNVSAGMSVTCGDVGGNVTAEMSVNCGAVAGNVVRS